MSGSAATGNRPLPARVPPRGPPSEAPHPEKGSRAGGNPSRGGDAAAAFNAPRRPPFGLPVATLPLMPGATAADSAPGVADSPRCADRGGKRGLARRALRRTPSGAGTLKAGHRRSPGVRRCGATRLRPRKTLRYASQAAFGGRLDT